MWHMINMDNLSLSHKMYKIYGNKFWKFWTLESENVRTVMVHTLKVLTRKLSTIKY